jgi:hypothetical protein
MTKVAGMTKKKYFTLPLNPAPQGREDLLVGNETVAPCFFFKRNTGIDCHTSQGLARNDNITAGTTQGLVRLVEYLS